MKKLRFIAMAMLAGCLLVAPSASARGQKMSKAKAATPEEQIKALSAELVQALLKSDASIYQKYLAEDAISIHSDGKQYTKAQEIEDLKSGSLKYDSLVVSDQKTRIYGNTAVVNQVTLGKGTLASKRPFSGEFRTTYVWVKQQGNWKLVLRQVTKVLPSQ